MAHYHVSIPVYATVFVRVEADSPVEAKEKAYENLYTSLCHQCSHEAELGEPIDNEEVEVYEIEG